MSERTEVYIALLDEGTDVWRPVDAEHVRDDEYMLRGAIPEGEVREFQPGDVVHCRERTFSNGSTALVAFARAAEAKRWPTEDPCRD
jgi:hypothetical protein